MPEFPILSLFKLQLDVSMINNAIHLSNYRIGFSLQSAICFDDIPWVLEGVYHTNIITYSQAHNLSPFNINESIPEAPQIESLHQDTLIQYSEPMEIDTKTSKYEVTRFLAMPQAEDENFTPESSQYSNNWSATPAQVQEILPIIYSDNWHHCLGHISASSIS